ncbi:MAG: DciA family protein [Hyphomicrobiaceae bacterium]|nr:DciA family protein [Hyphomicrobiaceae bacterium]
MADTRAMPITRSQYGQVGRQDGSATGRNRNFIAARTIGALTPRVTKTAFQKFGFATAQLVADWRTIVGDRLAETTAPDKLKWPRSTSDAGGDATARGGATLIVRVEPAVALDVQYQTALILERINAYFGYRAVLDLRIVQGAVVRADRKPAVDVRQRTRAPMVPTAPIEGIKDDGLKAALERMQAGMLSRKR